jgi:hypothetical protein
MSEGLISLTAVDWFTITGRGDVAAIAELPGGWYDPAQFIGRTILIDGKSCKVRGVEKVGCYDPTPELPHKGPFGLLVRFTEGE